jgi:outer membrane protein assembly factor BamE (lipoprotein component of BamABCDE complex)
MPPGAGERVAQRRLQVFAILLLPLLLGSFSGCAVVKATQQPDKKDLGILNPGVPRTHVIAELGSPVWTEEREGVTTDVFSFKQGYSKPVKAGRALAHGAADAFTFGLWEIVGVPVETLADGTDVQLEVRYDANRMVESVVVIRGEEAIGRPTATASKPQQTASRIDEVGRK